MLRLLKDAFFLARVRARSKCAKIRFEADMIRAMETGTLALAVTAPLRSNRVEEECKRLDRLVGKLIPELPRRLPFQLELPFSK